MFVNLAGRAHLELAGYISRVRRAGEFYFV